MGCTVTTAKRISPLSLSDSPSPHSMALPDINEISRPCATESEILSQLAQQGIIPTKRGQGGVEYSFPNIDCAAKKPSPFLEKLPKRIQFMNLEERMLLADIQRHHHLEKKRESVRRNNLKAQEKHKMVIEKRHNSADSALRKMSILY